MGETSYVSIFSLPTAQLQHAQLLGASVDGTLCDPAGQSLLPSVSGVSGITTSTPPLPAAVAPSPHPIESNSDDDDDDDDDSSSSSESSGAGDRAARTHADAPVPTRTHPIASDTNTTSTTARDDGVASSYTCNLCQQVFPDLRQQREHMKSDWHRFNLKRQQDGCAPLNRASFNELLTDAALDASNNNNTAGETGRSRSADDDVDIDMVMRATQAARKDGDNDEEWRASLAKEAGIRQRNADPLLTVVLTTPSTQDGKQQEASSSSGEAGPTVWGVTVYKSILGDSKDAVLSSQSFDRSPWYLERLQQLGQQSRIWVVIMCQGGHFCAVVFDGPDMVAHKSFHRYVVRAKRGTRQSTHDGTGHHPKSAGAELRRYNEAALRMEIKELLLSWREAYLDPAYVIWLAAPSTNRNTVLIPGGALDKQDPRLRNVPFITGRPTINEGKRIHHTLSVVPVLAAVDLQRRAREMYDVERKAAQTAITEAERSQRTTAAGAGVDGNADAAGVKIKGTAHLKQRSVEHKPKQARIKFNPPPVCELYTAIASMQPDQVVRVTTQLLRQQAAASRDDGDSEATAFGSPSVWRWPRERNDDRFTVEPLALLCQHGPVESVSHYLTLLPVDMQERESIVNTPGEEDWSALHHAAAAGHAPIVQALLDVDADPTLKTQDNKTAYNLARDVETRTVFRQYAGSHPDQWDYKLAQIFDPLSAQSAEATLQKKAQQNRKKNKKKALKKKEKKKEAREEEEVLQRAMYYNGRPLGEIGEKVITPKMSEREKRAAAAEARFAKAAGKTCAFCQQPLSSNQVPFTRLDYIYCSVACVNGHREVLES